MWSAKAISSAWVPMSTSHPPSLREQLRARYLEGRLVVFAGAGVSVAGGLPSWTGLIQQVLADAQASAAASELPALAEAEAALAHGDLVRALGVAQAIMTSAAYGRVVSRALDDSRHGVPPLARTIAGLAPTLHAVVTTNLDRFLERAFAGDWPSFSLPQLDLGQQRHYILQLHGNRTDRSSWILSEREYEDLLHGRPELQRFTEGLFRFHPLLFIGYGLHDPDFDRLCAQARVFARGQAPQHFAWLPEGHIDNYGRRRLADAGIEVMTYENADGSHAELLRLLAELGAAQPGSTVAVEAPPRATPPPPPVEMLRVLMVSASPENQVRLRVDQEFHQIIARVRATRHRDRFHFEQVQAVQFEHLRTALMEYQPHILHLSAHGDLDGSLVFEGDADGARTVPRSKIIRLLESLRDDLRLVVVNACHSQALARELAPAVGVAIGMSDAVRDAAAIAFAVAFYEGLGFGKSVEKAFDVALIGLDERDEAVPRLFPPAAVDPQSRRGRPLLALAKKS